MRTRAFALIAALGVAASPLAFAEDVVVAKADGRVIAFGDSGARFNVAHDASAGTMTFRLAEDARVRIGQAPTVTLQTPSGPRDVTLVSVDGQPNTWRLTHDVLRETRYDGTMKIVVDGRTYDAPLLATGVRTDVPAPGTVVTETKVVARYGGRVLSFPDCGGNVEVVHDAATGTITVYSLMGEDVKIVEAPVIMVTETAGPRTVTLTKVDGETVAWRTSHQVFRTSSITNAKIRLLVDGKACEAPLTSSGSARGGQIVMVEGGPRFEVVPDAKANTYTFYAIDETINGKAYTIDQPPTVVYDTPQGPRTVALTRVDGEPRAWRLAGIDGGISRPLDGRLRLTLFGKSLETKLGLSGAGINVK